MRLRTLALVFLLTCNIAQATDKEAFVFGDSPSPVTLSKYKRECRLIDRHLENPGIFILKMIDYTLEVLRRNKEFRIIEAHLPLLEGLEKVSEAET